MVLEAPRGVQVELKGIWTSPTFVSLLPLVNFEWAAELASAKYLSYPRRV